MKKQGFYINFEQGKEKYALGLVKLEILDRVLQLWLFVFLLIKLLSYQMETVTLTLIWYTKHRNSNKITLINMKKTRILSKWFQKLQKHFSKIGGLEFYRVLELEMSTIWKQCRGNDHWADESQCGAHFYNSLLNSSLSLSVQSLIARDFVHSKQIPKIKQCLPLKCAPCVVVEIHCSVRAQGFWK